MVQMENMEEMIKKLLQGSIRLAIVGGVIYWLKTTYGFENAVLIVLFMIQSAINNIWVEIKKM